MKRLALVVTMAFLASAAFAQTEEPRTQCGTPTGQERFPLYSYKELPQLEKPNQADWKKVKGVNLSWGSKDVRYSATSVPVARKLTSLRLKGWKGQRVFAQAVIWTGRDASDIEYEMSDLVSGKSVIPSERFENGFVRYVMADAIEGPDGATCNNRSDHTTYDSTMVADCIDQYLKKMDMKAMQTQPVWLTCWIPEDAKAGVYKGTLTVKEAGKAVAKVALSVEVEDKVLPDPSKWAFHLDLWQNPFAVARYYQVPLWSQEHMDAMRPVMERLAQTGQKVITASITHWPWNHQTEDAFETMITWTKGVDGTWSYGFNVFDKWVEFMMSCGIDKQINCYSMAPWKLTFKYLDEATYSLKEISTNPGEKEYEELWTSFLKAFAKHLKEKGWFEKTTIAMDERPMEVMQQIIGIVRKADPDFKISLAGNYYPEIDKDIYDYCILWRQEFPEGVIDRRRSEGKFSTYYTCCGPAYPNMFLMSSPSESYDIMVALIGKNSDGYLRWAYNSWPLEPLLDARYVTWPAGDTFLVYPGNRSSIRFQRILDGIQEYEKAHLSK